jgi:hypothetical protein
MLFKGVLSSMLLLATVSQALPTLMAGEFPCPESTSDTAPLSTLTIADPVMAREELAKRDPEPVPSPESAYIALHQNKRESAYIALHQNKRDGFELTEKRDPEALTERESAYIALKGNRKREPESLTQRESAYIALKGNKKRESG